MTSAYNAKMEGMPRNEQPDRFKSDRMNQFLRFLLIVGFGYCFDFIGNIAL